ncbi:MAG: nucleotide exchange factor GrpE [Chloroflexota bacterium]|nr:nucleotide exchange factor GrpE [Chloroflexota bacterium]
MTEDAENNKSNETTPPLDDPRFEVKWHKKEQSRASVVTEPEGTASADAPGDVAELQARLSEQDQRITDLQDKWHRAAADLVNLRRRTEQDKDDVQKFASMLLVQELLPVLDNFERAIATIPGNLAMLTWVHGVMLIERHLRAILEHRGLESIEAQGKPFSPHYHEAVSDRATDEASPGTVLQEYQRGYAMHGRVIRPTLVELAREPVKTEESSAPEPPQKPDGSAPAATGTEEAVEIADQAGIENSGP